MTAVFICDATPWAPAARGWTPRPSANCTEAAAGTPCAPCIGVGQGIALIVERV